MAAQVEVGALDARLRQLKINFAAAHSIPIPTPPDCPIVTAQGEVRALNERLRTLMITMVIIK